MGKKNQIASEDDLRDSTTGSSSPKKKHKHKHKKHKRKREATESEGIVEVESPKKKKRKKKERERDEGRSSLKLKIKLGGRTLTTKQVPTISPVVSPPSGKQAKVQAKQGSSKEQFTATWVEEPWQAADDVVDVQEMKDNEDQEEEDWLHALEAGELDDFGRLKQEQDTSTMTARQRAMLGHEIQGENELVELPNVSFKKDENSEEAVKRRKQRAKKRKIQMEKQIEENKVQTIERLLNKQVKSRKEVEKQKRIKKADIPRVTYLNNKNGISISFPGDMDVPFKKQVVESSTLPPVMCAVQGCVNKKRYSCSQTKLPLCSLECYKKIQQTHTMAVGVA